MKKKKKEDHRKKSKLSTESFYRFGIFLIACVLITGIITYERHGSEWRLDLTVGEPAPKDIFSPFSFTFVDEAKTEAAKRERVDQVFFIYTIDAVATARVLDTLESFFTALDTVRSQAETVPIPEAVRNVISETNLKEVRTMSAYEEFKQSGRALVTSLLHNGIISFAEKVSLFDQNKRAVTLIQEDGESVVSIIDLVSLSEARDAVSDAAVKYYPKDRKVRNALSEIVTNILQPNIIFSEELTNQRREKVYKETPNVEIGVKRNEVIVRRGRIISQQDLIRLKEIEKKITKKKVAEGIIGTGIIVIFFVIVLASYLFCFERKMYFSIKDNLLITTVIIINLILNRLTISLFEPELGQYLIPTSFAPLLLAMLIPPRAVMVIAVGMSILSGVMTNYNALVMIAGLFSSIVGLYLLIDVRRRSRFFIVGALVGAINFFIILGFLIFQEMTFIDAFNKASIGFGNGAIITILLFPGLFIFEKIFDKTTSISLLELSDLNHPLLKRLIIEAPGTYHHSLVVSNLAESASEAIAANALLARVGSYFHDIGKIEKANYFSENQTSKTQNIHDTLSPRMSYFIITNHVKDGIELARKNNLKQIIVDFIVQHHGTSIVYYFYKKALDSGNGDDKIDISDFRYPGPKPQSKEVAIVLLADSVEAASRTLSEPTPASLRGLVEKVVNDKFLDNQLDECELTVLDLHKIKDSFIHNLMAIFHTRVEYPEMGNDTVKSKRSG